MNESFSPVIFVYGMALIVGVGKACTLLIWRSLPRPRPRLRQEVREGWQHWRQRKSAREVAEHSPDDLGP
jgi:predicted MFS family arabinose efflux permease